MMNNILDILLDFIENFLNLLLLPLNKTIEFFLPSLSSGMAYISSFFKYIGNLIPWAVSYFGLNSEILSLVSAYLIFKISLPLALVPIKFIVKWYNTLKP